MTHYNSLNIKISNSQLKLKSATKNATEVALLKKFSSNMGI